MSDHPPRSIPTHDSRRSASPLLARRGAGGEDSARAVYDAFIRRFPGRVRACYAEGSLADGSRLATSDIDLAIVFADGFRDEDERHQAERLAQSLNRAAQIELDLTVTNEAALAGGIWPALKLASRLIAGTDVLHRFSLVPTDQWARERMHAAYWLTIKVHGRAEIVHPPLDYPDPTDEFYGYLRRAIRLPDGRTVPTTRDLIRTTGWAATALLAHQAGQYVARKRDCHILYRRHIGGAHAALLDDIYTLCRQRWQYRIPDDPGDRASLRDICRRALAFENDFLAVYIPYLLAELLASQRDGAAHTADTLRQPLRILREAPLADADVIAALNALAHTTDSTLSTSAHAILARLAPRHPAE
jgi:nucleotidyltransferase-like protein